MAQSLPRQQRIIPANSERQAVSRRTPPPFSKQIRKAGLLGASLKNVSLHCGNGSWERAQTREVSDATNTVHLVFPKDAEPSAFNWRCVAGLVVSILHNPDGKDAIYPPVLEELVAVLVKAGASRVYLIDHKWALRVYEPREAA